MTSPPLPLRPVSSPLSAFESALPPVLLGAVVFALGGFVKGVIGLGAR